MNYFEALKNTLEYKYEISVYSGLNKIPKQGMTLPAAYYFETIDKRLFDKHEQSREPQEFKPLLSPEKKNSFIDKLNNAENNPPPAVENYHQPEQSSWGTIRKIGSAIFEPKLATAASIGLILGFAAFWYINRTDSALQADDCKTLACLEKNELLNEKNINDFDDESLYEMVNLDDLDKNVSEQVFSGDSTQKNIEK